MAKTFLIIDGYNAMYAAGIARVQYGPGDLQRLRERFLRFLAARLSPAEREETTVVFDAGDAPRGLSRKQSYQQMAVLFAPPDSDADTVIEQLIESHSAPRQICVVSSDRRLQKAARRRRGTFVGSDSFWNELESRQPQEHDSARRSGSKHPKYGGQISKSETAHWLDVFDDVPEAVGMEDRDELDFWQSRVDELDGADDDDKSPA